MWFMQEKHPIGSKTVKDGSVNNFLTLSLTRQPITSCCLSLRFGSNVSEISMEIESRVMSHIGPCTKVSRGFPLVGSGRDMCTRIFNGLVHPNVPQLGDTKLHVHLR
jgi:hypothetical protein